MRNFNLLLIFVLLNLLIISCGESPSQKAKDLIDLGMHQEAIDLLKSEISKNPKDGDLHYTLAIVYIDLGKNRLAEESFERACQINNKYKNIIATEFWNRGLANLDKGDFRKAGDYISKATNQDSSILKNASDVFYKRGEDCLKSKKENSHELCASNFQYSLYFWGDRKKDDRYLKINSFVGNYENVLAIDSLNISALTGLMKYYWQRQEFQKSNNLLQKIRKRFPLSGDWLKLECITGNTIIARSEGASLVPTTGDKPNKNLNPFEVSKYKNLEVSKDENLIEKSKYVIDFSGEVYETRSGWINWRVDDYHPDIISPISGLLREAYRASIGDMLWEDVRINLFDSLPKNIKWIRFGDGRGVTFIGAKIIDNFKEGSIEFGENIEYVKFQSEDGIVKHMDFIDVNYECPPRWIESKYYIDAANVIQGTGDISLDNERVANLNRLKIYSDKEKENILDHKILKNLTEIELKIALGKDWKSLSEKNKEFVNDYWIYTLESENMSFNFRKGLLESWEINKQLASNK